VVAALPRPTVDGVVIAAGDGDVTYRIAAPADGTTRHSGQSAAFTVDASSGNVVVAKPLDYETIPAHTIVVIVSTVSSSGTEAIAAIIKVTISIVAVACIKDVSFSATGTFPCQAYTICKGGRDFEMVAATTTSDRSCAITKTNVAGDGSKEAILIAVADQMNNAGNNNNMDTAASS